MIVAGSMGIGLVWGWLLLLVWREVPGQRPLRHLIASFIATILACALFIWLAEGIHLFVFVGTAVFSFILHLSWRTRLRENVKRDT